MVEPEAVRRMVEPDQHQYEERLNQKQPNKVEFSKRQFQPSFGITFKA